MFRAGGGCRRGVARGVSSARAGWGVGWSGCFVRKIGVGCRPLGVFHAQGGGWGVSCGTLATRGVSSARAGRWSLGVSALPPLP